MTSAGIVAHGGKYGIVADGDIDWDDDLPEDDGLMQLATIPVGDEMIVLYVRIEDREIATRTTCTRTRGTAHPVVAVRPVSRPCSRLYRHMTARSTCSSTQRSMLSPRS